MDKEFLKDKSVDELINIIYECESYEKTLEKEIDKLNGQKEGFLLLIECIKKIIDEYHNIDKKNFTNINKQKVSDCLITNITSYLDLWLFVNKK